MSLLFGAWAHVWASIVAVPLAIVITAVIFWFYRWSIVQRVVMPGADECRILERSLVAALDEGKPLTPGWAAVASAMLHRNGLNAVAVAIVFLAVFTGAHALLAAM